MLIHNVKVECEESVMLIFILLDVLKT